MWILDKIRSRSSTIRLEELSIEWLELKKTTIKQSTYYKYAYCIEKYFNLNEKNIHMGTGNFVSVVSRENCK